MNITETQFRAIVPDAPRSADVFIPYLVDTMLKYNINTKGRAAMFMAQIAHESGSFRYTKEIASGTAYEHRLDLGNTTQGDGVLYKGRGLIQITGRNNYKALSDALGVDFITHPGLLEELGNATFSAGWFWDKKGLNKYADYDDAWRSENKKYDPFQMVTYLINGGQNGIAERTVFYKKALNVLV